MAAPAVKSQLTTFSISTDNAAGTPVIIDGVISVADLDSGEAPETDVTVLSSTEREFMLGLTDPGTFTMSLRFNLDDPGQAELYKARKDGVMRKFVCTLNATNPTLLENIWTANVLVKKMGPDDISVDGVFVTGSVTFRVTGATDWT